jgi:hypothetical protein
MTNAQLQALRTSIAADPALAAMPNTADAADVIAAAYNAPVAPDFWVYKTSVSNEAIGDAMNGTEVAGLASLAMQRLQVLGAYSNGTQNPSRADRRAAFDAAFTGAGGAATRAALAVLWRRLATRIEKLFAVGPGTGTAAAPATLAFEGVVSYPEVQAARNLA